jgi:Ca2+-binding RTX toxin-like protein
VFGGPGDDDVRGNRGADRLSGGTGRDYLDGGSGADRLFGGGGNDKLQARDRSADRADCGHGRDRATIDAKDTVQACERLRRGVYTSRR